jgi:tetratricopeptide (TPR) repeat protein
MLASSNIFSTNINTPIMNILGYITISCIVAFNLLSLSGCKHEEKIPVLLERKATKSYDTDKGLINKTYSDAIAALKKNPDDLQQYINLASAFITEGRITGNTTYYNNAALQMLAKVIKSNTANNDLNFQAYTLQSSVLLNYHQFKDALQSAEKGVAINNYSSGIYGALIDANVELGNYDKAVAYCDKMLSLRPDLRSYSRASYLRQIYGENKGAIQAMTMAVEAGVPRCRKHRMGKNDTWRTVPEHRQHR